MTDLHDASSGLGEATALHLYALGARVVLAARRTDKLDALVAELVSAGGTVYSGTRFAVKAISGRPCKNFDGIREPVAGASGSPLSQLGAHWRRRLTPCRLVWTMTLSVPISAEYSDFIGY
jgi:hypothetical protein